MTRRLFSWRALMGRGGGEGGKRTRTNRKVVETVPETSGRSYHLSSDVDFLEVRGLNGTGIVSSRLGASKDGADERVYVLHGSSRAHNTVSPGTFTVKRRTSCNPGPKSAMQRRRRTRRRISHYPRDLGRTLVAGIDRYILVRA